MTTRKKKTHYLSPEKAILIAVVLILLVLLFNSFCRFGFCGEVGPAFASVKVRCAVQGGFATGSGTAIDPHYVITCEHVTNSTPENGKFEIFNYHKNKWVPAVLAAAQPGDGVDISVLRVDEELDYVPLGMDIQPSGYKLGIEGYGFAGTDILYSRKGTLLGDSAAKIDIRYGDSGGGLFENNKLIGVIWGSANPEGGANQMQQNPAGTNIQIYTNNVCHFTPLRTIGRALRNWCATGRLRPMRPNFGITITQDKVQNGSGRFCPGGNCPQGTPGYNGGFDGGNISPNGNNPYFPNPEIDNENDGTPNSQPNGQPPIAGDPIKPKPNTPVPPEVTPETPGQTDGGTNEQIASLEEKIKELEKNQEDCKEIKGKLDKTEKELENAKNELAKRPSGKIRIKVNPKTGVVSG